MIFGLFCFLLKFSLQSDQCQFESIPSSAKAINGMAEASRGFLSTFGLDALDYYPGPSIFDSSNDDLVMDYVVGAISFAVPFAVLFVLILLFSIIYFCACCKCCFCCCSKSGKPGLLLIIVHFIGIAAFIISGILFTVASVNIVNGIKRFSLLPTNMDSEFTDIFNKVQNTFSSTFTSINGMVSDVESSLRGLSSWLTVSGAQNVENAQKVKPLTNDYEKTFTNTGEYKTTKTKLDSNVQNDSVSLGNDFPAKLQAMDESIQPAVKKIEELADTLVGVSSDLNGAASNINSTIDGSIQDVKQKVHEFENGELVRQFNQFQMSIDDLVTSLEFLSDISVIIDKYVNPVIIAACVLLILIGILYAVIFFFRNCFARCCFRMYSCIMVLLSIVIILPAIIFSAIFLIVYDICPDLEAVVETQAGFDYGNLTGALVCAEEAPLLDMLDLGFDYDSIIDDLSSETSELLKSFDIPENLKSKLTGYGYGFDVEKHISSNYIILNHQTTLSSLITAAQSSSSASQKDAIISDSKLLQTYISNEEENLAQVRTLMKSVIDFGSNVVPRLESSRTNTGNIVNDFSKQAKIDIADNINNITCRNIRCVYSPVRNALCYNFISGISFWILSSVLLICSFAVLFVTICCRRGQTLFSSKVSVGSSSSDDYELQQFNPY